MELGSDFPINWLGVRDRYFALFASCNLRSVGRIDTRVEGRTDMSDSGHFGGVIGVLKFN